METENRGNLLRSFIDLNYSWDTRMICSNAIKDMTDMQKEEKAAQMLAALKNSQTETEFLSNLRRQRII